MEKREIILVLSKAVQSTFTSSEWTEIGYLTGMDEYINEHPRLLRSLQWGDDDYKGHVIDAVATMIQRDSGILQKLIDYDPIARWLQKNEAGPYEEIKAKAHGLHVPEVYVPTSKQAAYEALADAQALLRTRGATSAVDRIHTGIHGYLRATCIEIGITPASDANANQLLKLLISNHPVLTDLGPRGEDVRRILRASASIIDALGTIRNQASLAHPNEELLDRDEALLVINIARSILGFLDAKLSKT